jgi:hypothetical protein
MNRKQITDLISLIDKPGQLANSLRKLYPNLLCKTGTWGYHSNKLINWINGGMENNTPFNIFIKSGNTKLPFVAFSSLPLVDCPGKGECVNYCYSLKAWRYPAALFRQIQNSLLIRNNFSIIAASFYKLKPDLTVRLYVDGDFNSVETLRNWMTTLSNRPDLSVYGYSKSWLEFVTLARTGFMFPSNYLTNASNGSKWINTGISNEFKSLAVVRGAFDAVTVSRSHINNHAYQGKDRVGSSEYRKDVLHELKKYSDRVFACPGRCGDCLPRGRHACGDKSFMGVTIGIGIHS